MAKASAKDEAAGTGGITRREFLFYVWGASIALFTAQAAGLLVWFLLPRFREGEFGGRFILPLENLPGINEAPTNIPEGRFWLVNLDSSQPNERMSLAEDEQEPIVGVAAIYKVCTHLGCIYSWTAANNRFECPCHGSKYRLDGRRIEAPAPRDLDRFKLEFLDADQNLIDGAESPLVDDFYEATPVPANASFVSIDTGDRKLGLANTLICSFVGNCP